MTFRIASGALINEQKPITVTFDGKPLAAFEGDSAASALLAAGVRLAGRSFKYHRPRGLMAAGSEETNVLLTVTHDGRREPNCRAPEIRLKQGMVLESQNCWPSLRYDIGALNQLAGPIFSAGFYYKTFMGLGLKGWVGFEHIIRRAAGLGAVGTEKDPALYDNKTLFCDHLIVGGGFAGLLAARANVATGKKVIWAEQHALNPLAMAPSGTMLDGKDAAAWCEAELTHLREAPNLTILEHCSVAGLYDQGVVSATQQVESGDIQECFYEIEPHHITLATGALERPLAFAGNDRPGVMLGSSAETYLRDFGVAIGKKLVGFTNNDSLYHSCFALAEAGVKIAAIIDSRSEIPSDLKDKTQTLGIALHLSSAIFKTEGKLALSSVTISDLTGKEKIALSCDGLLMSGGWNPVVHLWSQAGGNLRFDDGIQAFVPTGDQSNIDVVGAAAGHLDLGQCLAAARAKWPDLHWPETGNIRELSPIPAFWGMKGKGKAFVDFQNDVTMDDIEQASDEGYRSVEHLKRYTTLGMGTDQGKTSNVTALALMAATLGKEPAEVGTTKFRPPYKPTTFGAVAGLETGPDMVPTRRTALHAWHEAHGCHFLESGDWLRAAAYPQSGESVREAAIREARNVRKHAGLVDVSTLGKILVEGPDALELLNRVYVNAMTTLKVDRSRYGVMLRDDGMVMDDGTVARLGDNRYLITTTTANAGSVFRNLDRHLQVDWTDLRCAVTSLTDHYTAIALAGPKSRAILEKLLGSDADVSNEALPFMGHIQCSWQDHQIDIFRVSFSGEMAYELFIQSDHGIELWEGLMEAGSDDHLRPYGVKALDILRTEKGHLTGAEIDGRRTLADIGFGRMAKDERYFIGKVMARRDELQREDRLQIVGLKSINASSQLIEGMHLIDPDLKGRTAFPKGASQGHITSACFSPVLENEIALAVLKDGRARHGQTLLAVSPMQNLEVEVSIADPVFIDPKGEWLRG